MQSDVEAPGLSSADGSQATPGLRHQALLCPDRASGLVSALAFAREGIGQGEAVSIGVSAPLGAPLRDALGGEPRVAFFDMTELGRNPRRIISAMLDFATARPGRALRYVSEPLFPGRRAAERNEAACHEALIGVALPDQQASVLCLYNTAELDDTALSCAELTHPDVISGGRSRRSGAYAGPGVMPRQCEQPLSPVPGAAAALPYYGDLRPVRALVTERAQAAGLPRGRTADLTLAVSEVAANTLRHTSGDGILHVWRTPGQIVCQITDSGTIADPLVGRRRPAPDSSGQGMWVVNQVCDLVELRTGPDGTTVRMHMDL
jgi:anti-sigma regulatory factor (Ser/Thr protein kinase)